MWSEIRRPGSLPFMQEDKEKSQHCASLLVTQHCGVACCPLIVVPLLLLAANAVRLDKAAALLQQMMDVFLIQFSAHFVQPPEGRQSKSKQTRLSSQKIWPETLSLSSSTNLEFRAICELQIQSNAPLFSIFQRAIRYRRVRAEEEQVAVCMKSPADCVVFQLWKSVFWVQK